jgi:hypothetical protein
MPRVPVRQPPSVTPDGQKGAKETVALSRELEKLKTTVPSTELWVGKIVLGLTGGSLPEGWHECDGAEIARLDYPEFFEVWGDTFGPGDGATTVNLPTIAGPIADTTVFVYLKRA